MISVLKRILGNKSIRTEAVQKEVSTQQIIENWQAEGKPVPPPHVIKQLIIKDAKDKYGCGILIETGTYLGDMVEAQKKHFGKIYSIELGEKLYEDAVKRFEGDENVTILFGDSGKVLKALMPKICEPAIFWLDGHYSAGVTAMGEKQCPIYEELEAIFASKPFNHVLLIDDARLFVGKDDYPTFEELTDFIKEKKPHATIYVKDDAIHAII